MPYDALGVLCSIKPEVRPAITPNTGTLPDSVLVEVGGGRGDGNRNNREYPCQSKYVAIGFSN